MTTKTKAQRARPPRPSTSRPRSVDYCTDVGARIQELADWREMSRMTLASKAGLHVNAVNKMIVGKSDMRLSTLVALSEALEVPICELLP